MIKAIFLVGVGVFLLLKATAANDAASTPTHKIPQVESSFIVHFGSCNKQFKRQPMWEVLDPRPRDIFLFLGDNIYADHPFFLKWRIPASLEDIRRGYDMQKKRKEYVKYLAETPVHLGTWDDHDFGKNDGDRTWSYKMESQQYFLDFFDFPQDSPRRQQHGVYSVWRTTKDGLSIRTILLDLRYHKDPQAHLVPRASDEQDILGQEQWNWLETELKKTRADITFIGSSLQVIPDEKLIAEGWHKYPASKAKLMSLLAIHDVGGVIFLSGDIHFAELNYLTSPMFPHPLLEATSSGMTHAWAGPRSVAVTYTVPGSRHLTPYYLDLNAGEVDIRWTGSCGETGGSPNTTEQPCNGTVFLRILGESGVVRQHKASLAELLSRPSNSAAFSPNLRSVAESCASSNPHFGLSDSCAVVLESFGPAMTEEQQAFVIRGYLMLACMIALVMLSLCVAPCMLISRVEHHRPTVVDLVLFAFVLVSSLFAARIMLNI